MADTIQVIRVDDDGKSAENFSGRPCIDIGLGFGAPRDFRDGRFGLETVPVRALIDTGAELSLIDERLIPAGTVRMHQLAHGGTTGGHLADVHLVTYAFSPPGAFLTMDALSLPAAPRPFSVILGRDVLAHFDFDWRAGQGIVNLRFLA